MDDFCKFRGFDFQKVPETDLEPRPIRAYLSLVRVPSGVGSFWNIGTSAGFVCGLGGVAFSKDFIEKAHGFLCWLAGFCMVSKGCATSGSKLGAFGVSFSCILNGPPCIDEEICTTRLLPLHSSCAARVLLLAYGGPAEEQRVSRADSEGDRGQAGVAEREPGPAEVLLRCEGGLVWGGPTYGPELAIGPDKTHIPTRTQMRVC